MKMQSTENSWEVKNRIRQRVLQERKLLDYDSSVEFSNIICRNLLKLLNSIVPGFLYKIGRHEHHIGMYWPMQGEPELSKVILYANYVGLPKLVDNKMSFIKYTHGDALEQSKIPNLYEPVSNIILKPDVLIIPGLAFSVNGCRLGFGKGIYDQYIRQENKDSLLLIGVCFHQWLFNYLPHYYHDSKLDYIITEQHIIKTS